MCPKYFPFARSICNTPYDIQCMWPTYVYKRTYVGHQGQSNTCKKNICTKREVEPQLYLLYFSRTLLPSASSGYTIGRLSLTQLFTSVIGIPISLYHLSTSSSQRFRGLPLGRRPSGWITSDWCVTTTWSCSCWLFALLVACLLAA